MNKTDKKIAHLTLGCDKNRVDTERTLGACAKAGFQVVAAPERAFALVINTCGFISGAKEEGIDTIIDAARAKEEGGYEVLAVVGCLVQRYRDELKAEIPEVDLWMGLEHPDQLAAELNRLYREKHSEPAGPPPSCIALPSSRLITTPSHYSFLKIADGCSSVCRFCAIPRIRGPLRSSPLDALIAEARALEESGVKELNLVAQDTTAYGRDLTPKLELADLIERLLAETQIPWIRILYAHPNHVTDRLISLLAHEPRLLRYLDLPLQHASDSMLDAMGRKPGRAGVIDLVGKLKFNIPNLALRTTFLVGYPGETRDDFEDLIEFMNEAQFLWASAFAYSPEEGTPAYNLEDRPDPEEVEERLDELFDLQRNLTAARLEAMVDTEAEVLVDGPWEPFIDEENGETAASQGQEWSARLPIMAVEVDGAVRVKGDVQPGEFVKVKIEEAFDYDLSAVVISAADNKKEGRD